MEPVVHSGEWTTSSCEIGDFPGFPAKSKKPVVHSGKWTTSWHEIEAFPWFLAKSEEPVVHSGEWTTGARAYGYFPNTSNLTGSSNKAFLSQISLDNYS